MWLSEISEFEYVPQDDVLLAVILGMCWDCIKIVLELCGILWDCVKVLETKWLKVDLYWHVMYVGEMVG